jgi:branched-chain amino acid transport system ATP-binding protein
MLKITDLDIWYEKVQALDNISLRIEEKELVSVIGANGSGKTTLVRAIMGFIPCARGKIMIGDIDLTHLKPWERTANQVCYVPEGSRIFASISVEENLIMGAFSRNDSQIIEDLEEIYRLFPVLRERKKLLGGMLSGGECQMLSIGRGLMSKAKVLIIDEMSMGLMPILVRRLFQLIKDLTQTGLSILLIEQNARMALNVADRGYLLENGRIVLEGTRDQLIQEDKVKRSYLGG